MCSWQKGTVENTIGLFRRWLTKKTDFEIVPEEQIQKTQEWLNSLPRKCLGFRTPKEALKGVALNG